MRTFTHQLAEMSAARQDSSYARRLQSSLGDRDLIIGVDRLDYSKGLPERLHSYECLLQTYPEHLAQVVLLQIAAPSRIDIRGYQEIKRELEARLQETLSVGSIQSALKRLEENC